MRTFISATLLALFVSTGVACGGDDASCEKVVDHTLKIMPKEFRDQMGKDKKPLIKKCEKDMSEKQRKCVLKAKDMEAMTKCR